MGVLGLLDDEVVEGPIRSTARTPKTIASAEVLWGPLVPPPAIPPAGLLPAVPDVLDPIPDPVYDLTPLPNDLTVVVGPGAGTPWVYSTQRTVTVPINDPGTGSAAGPLSDPVGATIAEDDIVRFYLKGTAVLMAKATKLSRKSLTPEEEAGMFVTVHADGVLAEWADCIVLPDLGAGAPTRLAPPRQETRIFNYSASAGVDDTAWTNAVVTDPLYGTGPFQRFTRPESWPDPLAGWIWDRDSSIDVPVGTMRFRRIFNLPIGFGGPMQVQIWVAADGLGEVSLDGIPIAQIPGPYSGQSFHVDAVLGDHFHLLTAKLTNFVGRSGFIFSVLPVDGDHLGPAIARSDPSTKCFGYADPALFTPGKIIRILFQEVRVRGALLNWTLGFDDDVDSNGNPWDYVYDYPIRVGLDYLSVLKQMAEQWIDFKCSPSTRTLYAYRVGELGTASTAPLDNPATLRAITIENG